ncbi:MAG: ATP-binding protein, partial [Bryobacteraceae bacterium]
INAALGDGPVPISGNQAALHRLFLLLLDNAVKYSRDGGEVRLTLDRAGARFAVAIQDFGEGIAEADLPHIFKRFYRTGRAGGGGHGHGLGLSLAQSIVRAHGGEIQVDSQEGEGSTFRVLFASRDVGGLPESAALHRAGGANL